MSARLLNGYWVLAIAGFGLLFSAGAYAADLDGDGIDDTVDLCLATNIPELAPTRNLKKNHHALTGVPDNTTFKTSPKNKNIFTTADTGGCSCEQIVDEQGLGPGHIRFGCSNSVMLAWVATVVPAAADDAATVTEDDPATVIAVLANDIPATITAVTQPTNGIVVNNGTDVTYEPDPDYCNDPSGPSTDDFDYTILGGSPATATVAMTVTCVNDAPVITSDGGGANAAVNADENQTAVTTVTANDIDVPAQTLTFSITGGADQALFGIVGTTGVLTFNSPPDYENAADAGGDNVYDVRVTVTDDGAPNLSDVQDIAVTVDDVNDAPVITSDGGGATASVNAAENQTAVTTVTATDEDLPVQTLTFSISGGADAALFGIIGSTGVLTFNSAPDFENPTDADPDGDYEVQVTVTDDGTGALTDVQDITVTVTDVNEAPVITSDGGGATASLNVDENTTAVTTVTAADVDAAQTLTFSISGGADAALFGITAGGALTFNSAPDFETPTDSGGNNVYDVQVTVTDDGAPTLSDVQDIAVSVDDVNENVAPVITSDGGGATASVNAAENQTAVTTVTATDADVPAQTLTFTISGGADQALFGIAGGVLTFLAAPDFENPTDAGGNNVYDVQVTVTDDGAPNLTDVQDIAVTVTDVNDAPVITSDGGGATASVNAAENQTAVTTVTATDADVPAQTLTFSITGGADQALFGIAGGMLTFNSAPDFENPTDAGGNNVYDVQVTVTDSGAPNLTDVQDIAVTVTGANDAPVITSNGGGATAAVNAAENQTAVTTVTATDTDSPAQTLTFTITGGADQALFGIAGGVLTFNSAPDFENPLDAGSNNVYDVQVTVTDDGAPNLSDVQDIAVTVTGVNDAPVITSDGGGATAAVNAAENQTAVTTVTATDSDLPAQTLTFTISGGADQALFGIAGGVLTFNNAPDFENPIDAGGNNVYDVQVTVTDNGAPNLSDVQDIAVTVTDVVTENVAPVITSNGGGATASVNAAENQTAVNTVTATDADVPAQTLTFSITGGADAGLFGIAGGVLTFNAAPDFENPTDAGGDNVYDVQVTVTDDGIPNLTDVQDIAVTVTDANDPPVGVADSYTGAIGNTDFRLVAALSGTTPVPPTVELVGSVGDNDQDEDGDTVGAVAGTVGTTQGGSVTIDANGRFVYSPPAGFTGGTDSFDYTPSDGVDTAASTATVDIDVTNIVWYVDDSSPNNPGTGTSADAFRNLSSASGAPTLPGQTIFVFQGTHTTGITLQNNQMLLGEGLALVIGTTTLVDAGTRPFISNPGTAITLGSGNTVRGLNISGSNVGISGTAFGTLTADTMAINTTGGPGINLSNGAGSVTLDSLSSSASSGSGIDMDSVTGTFTLGSGSISGSTNEGINITNSSATISYSGTVTAGSGLAVNVSSHSANSVSLSGQITSSGQGILLNANTGGTINLSGGVSLSTGAFTAFSATNGGTVNVTGTNTVTTTTATAVAIVDTIIGSSDVIFESITSTGASSNVAIILDDTGAGEFMVTGTGGTCAVGTPTCTGGGIANKTGDAITLNTTGGRVTLMDMIIEDIGSTGGGFNTRSQHDAIHGEDVLGGLTLNNVLIDDISDMCINGATFGGPFSGLGATTWNGLDIFNSTIQDCNRWHVTNTGDTSDEGAVRIVGLTGTVNIDNSTIQRAGELLDLFTAPTGTLNMTVTNSDFSEAYKEFSPAVSGTSVIGKFCIDVTVEGSSDANVTIGGAGLFPNNEFINCATASIRVAKDTVPAGNSNIDAIVNNNQFRTTDQTPANGIFGNTPQGGVLLRAGPGGIGTFDGIVSNNTFGISIGPNDRIGSTGEEIANADGVPGNVSLIFDSGVSQARVNNNTFNGSLNAPWANRADGNTSAKVLYVNNSYRGRDDYCCDGGFTFTVPGIPYRTDVRNGGAMDITLRNDNFIWHDQFFFAQTETIEMNSQTIGGGGTLNVCLDNVTSGDGFEFDEDAGTINLYQGAVNNAATGPCVAEADGHSVSACELEAADDGVRGGPSGHSQSSGPNPALNPPHIDIDGGAVTITAIACQEPSGGIF